MAAETPSGALPTTPIAGRFEIEAQLGRGGMAAVYRVRDVRTGDRYALKRIWAKDQQRALRRKATLEREYHTLAQLRHPRIIEVYDFGVDEDGPYYTMELLDGADLEQRGRVPWQEACALLRDIASSLAIVHSRGLLHRDVSARNVRRTADGRAKLIDFGTLMSIGVSSEVVGTPPFMPPEALQLQALDARADLYSLGALGYYLLTGRHAYPARRASDLRDMWRTRPAPPSRIDPDLPPALNALIMQLIALDRGARPHTAAEVMERLCAIADLPKEDLPAIMRGYLTTPTLVGRHSALLSIRTRMLSLVRGDGGALVVRGPPGSGRSRMLEACVFEGKLLSAHVAHANSSAGDEPWGVARSIANQLFALLPDEAREASRLSSQVLSYLVDELRPAGESRPLGAPERSLLMRELRDFTLTLAEERRILIVVDDADFIDEASMAWLASVGDKIDRHNLMLVVSCESDRPARAGDPLDLFCALANSVALPALDGEQTEALIRSLFGDTAKAGAVAAHIHALAHGSPRAIMELAQHLVDRGLARYEAGSWVLPQQLDPHDMPATLSDSLAQRLAELSPDARELVEVASVVDAHAFTAHAYCPLTQHTDQKRVFGALEELVSARVLIVAAGHYRFTQRGFVSLLRETLPPTRKSELHGRYADLLTQRGEDPLRRAEHLLEAGRADEAIALLSDTDLQNRLAPLALLERAVAHAERSRDLSPRALHRLRMALLARTTLLLEADKFLHHLPPVLHELERDSGLALYRELRDVPLDQRLNAALTQQDQRYRDQPETERVCGVFEAVRELARLTGFAFSVAGSVFDLTLLHRMPSLEPFLQLTPALQVVNDLRAATHAWVTGRREIARGLYIKSLDRMAQPDRAGFDDAQWNRTYAAVHYVWALVEAHYGVDRAEELARVLEELRPLRVSAWRVRSLLQLSQGDADTAAKSARRAELLQLQDERDAHYPGTGVGLQLSMYCFTEDLLGVKRMLEPVRANANQHPGWRPMWLYGQSYLRALSGDLEGALERVLAGFAIGRPGESMPWGFLAAHHVKLLRELGRVPEAVACGTDYVALMEREQITMGERHVRMELSRACASAGEFEKALALIDPLLAQVEAERSRGFSLGVFHEARAYVALAMRDREAFLKHAERCAKEYEHGRNPALTAKFARLMDEARQLGLVAEETPDFEQALQLAPESPDETEGNTIVSRLLECVDASDRARCALTMLLQISECHLGHLYGVRGDRLVALAGLPQLEADPEFERWLVPWVCAECELLSQSASATTLTEQVDGGELETHTHTHDPDADPSGEYVDAEGRRHLATLLVDRGEDDDRLVAVFVILAADAPPRRPPLHKLICIARHLIAHNDVQTVALRQIPSVLAS